MPRTFEQMLVRKGVVGFFAFPRFTSQASGQGTTATQHTTATKKQAAPPQKQQGAGGQAALAKGTQSRSAAQTKTYIFPQWAVGPWTKKHNGYLRTRQRSSILRGRLMASQTDQDCDPRCSHLIRAGARGHWPGKISGKGPSEQQASGQAVESFGAFAGRARGFEADGARRCC